MRDLGIAGDRDGSASPLCRVCDSRSIPENAMPDLLDLWHMTMSSDAIAVDAFSNLSVEQIDFAAPPCTTDSRFGIHNDVILPNQALLQHAAWQFKGGQI